ncbi:MAG: extracellular solute-binding protein, partial [Spirochaetia bacterium]|nr:extracellular solute-binding protein [Spirochaetia bacterium]
EYLTMPADMLDSLVVWMTSRDSTVDIYGIDVPWTAQFGRAGWAVPLNDRLPQLEADFTPGGLDTFSYKGQRLGVPFWNSVTGLFYRKDLLEEYGFAPPKTLDDMTAIITEIQTEQPEITGFLWPGAREESLVMFYSTLLHAFGGTYLGDDGSYQFDSPASRRAVEFMISSIDEELSPRAVTGWERMDMRPRFVEGKALFSWDNADIITWLDDPERSQVAGKWGFMPFPSQANGNSVSISGGFAFSINPFSKNIDAAVKVMEVIAGKTVQKGFALAWGPVQHYKGLYDDAEVQEYNPNAEKLQAVTEIAINRPPSKSYTELSSMLQEELHAAITGSIAVDRALENMAERAEIIDR